MFVQFKYESLIYVLSFMCCFLMCIVNTRLLLASGIEDDINIINEESIGVVEELRGDVDVVLGLQVLIKSQLETLLLRDNEWKDELRQHLQGSQIVSNQNIGEQLTTTTRSISTTTQSTPETHHTPQTVVVSDMEANSSDSTPPPSLGDRSTFVLRLRGREVRLSREARECRFGTIGIFDAKRLWVQRYNAQEIPSTLTYIKGYNRYNVVCIFMTDRRIVRVQCGRSNTRFLSSTSGYFMCSQHNHHTEL